ncbi:uncharacterized protein [Misgurnus anguillicaudatus]|uniref:uncharacterized protein n=1 Tax=Misgurnus anguillicaudatus TaxID=75329 RepID=UPI003CCF908F
MAPKRSRTETQALGDPENDNGSDPQGAGGGDGKQISSESSSRDIAELKDMFQRFVVDQQDRQVLQEQENARQETRLKSLQHQFRLLQGYHGSVGSLQPGGSEGPDTYARNADRIQHPSVGGLMKEPKMQQLGEMDDIEHYLTTFERIAIVCRWPTEDWAIRLVPLLTGKARAAYVAMDLEEATDYEQVKEAILRKYSINAEVYRQRFRSMEVLTEETPKELYVWLRDLLNKWVKPAEKTVDQFAETIVLEQFLRMLCPELQTWIKEHDPGSAEEAAKLAEVFVAARKRTEPWSYAHWKAVRDKPSSRKTTSLQEGGKSMGERLSKQTEMPSFSVGTIRCYSCGQIGHKKPMCPNLNKKLSSVGYVPKNVVPVSSITSMPNDVTIPVDINGKKVIALVDTGCTQTLVEADLVSESSMEHKCSVTVKCIHGEERSYPTTEVYLGVNEQTFKMKVGLASNLPYPVIIGHDYPLLMDLLHPSNMCNVVLTRAKTKQSQNQVENETNSLNCLPYYDCDIPTHPVKPVKTRAEKRSNKFQGTKVQVSDREGSENLNVKGIIPADMSELQKVDSEIGPIYSKMVEQAKQGRDMVLFKGSTFCLMNELLYRKTQNRQQMVLPMSVCKVVLRLGHSIPWAGHLGRRKMHHRISRHFFWPGMTKDIAEFCKICPECQCTALRGPPKAPLMPLPIIDVPFQRLGMDIVGPLERSKAGNKYMLVICDYGSRYPEVFPLKNIKACSFLFGLKTSPYHPETDGLVERFNQTLVQMLRKFLVYGHDVRGPLSLLKESWEQSLQTPSQVNVIDYVLQMREKLEKMTKLAVEHLREAQGRQKSWYDVKAKQRSFEVGQQVLVMLPTEENKLLGKWQGPFKVTKKLGSTTYEIATPGRSRSHRTLHINLLKEWFPQKESANVMLV